MPEIKDVSTIGSKWTRVTPQRSEDYQIGVKAPRRSWSKQALAQKDTWKTAITQAAANDQYAKGVTAAGDARWQDKSLTKGPTRFSEGVMTAGPDFEKGFAPYAATIKATTLPPRYPKGDPRNVERVRVMSSALRAAKVGK